MPNENTIPSDGAKTVVTATILSGGSPVSQIYHVLSVVISSEVNRIPSAVIVLSDGDTASQNFVISSDPVFEPGKDIEIQLGYSGSNDPVFKGIVIKHAIKSRKANSVLIVECRDKACKMTAACKSNYYKDMKDSDVMEQLIDNHGLDKDVTATQLQHKQMVQYNCTDWDFLLCRADANGLLCIAKEGKLSVAPPALSGASVLTVQYGATVHELDAAIDARLQFKSVKGSSWDYTDQELKDDVEASEPSMPAAGDIDGTALAAVLDENEFRLFHSGKIEEPELQQWVDAKMLKHRLAKIRGQVTIDGTAVVNPGQVIELKGVGSRFEGKLFVTAIRHQFENGNWLTSIQFGINPEWFAETFIVQQPQAGALLPAVEGLQVGVVTKLESDPDGEGRVQVRVPVIHKDDDGAWCRISSLDAGKDRGMFFMPEISDEVIVGFINNDPRHGVILGMLNSSKLPAAFTPGDDNHEKGYTSRSQMKMIFNDDKKSITIETPGGNKMIITEEDKKVHLEDQNGNILTMNEHGISIESIKDIKIKASGDVKIEGTNLNIKGSSQVKVEGGSGTEISSGGTTNVKGSMVNIN